MYVLTNLRDSKLLKTKGYSDEEVMRIREELKEGSDDMAMKMVEYQKMKDHLDAFSAHCSLNIVWDAHAYQPEVELQCNERCDIDIVWDAHAKHPEVELHCNDPEVLEAARAVMLRFDESINDFRFSTSYSNSKAVVFDYKYDGDCLIIPTKMKTALIHAIGNMLRKTAEEHKLMCDEPERFQGKLFVQIT